METTGASSGSLLRGIHPRRPQYSVTRTSTQRAVFAPPRYLADASHAGQVQVSSPGNTGTGYQADPP